MKQLQIFVFVLCLFSAAFASQTRENRLFNEQGQAHEALMQVLIKTGMDPTHKNIFQVNTWAQSHLLRMKERCDPQTTRFDASNEEIKALLKQLGLLDEVSPRFKTYDGAILHGAFLSRVRLRIQFLLNQWNQGVRFPTLYFLTGARPLDPVKESEFVLKNDPRIRKNWTPTTPIPKTEKEMMQWVWDQTDVPQDLRKYVQVYFVNATMREDPVTKQTVRPTTIDTVVEWQGENPLPGTYLSVSSAPYIFRQDLTTHLASPKTFTFDTVGPAVDPNEDVAILLDELARWIYTTLKQTTH